jgi:hypothetical protein
VRKPQLTGSRSLPYTNIITGTTLESLYDTANSCSECFTNAFVLHMLSRGLQRSHQDSILEKEGIVSIWGGRGERMVKYRKVEDRHIIAVPFIRYVSSETDYHYVSPPVYSGFL